MIKEILNELPIKKNLEELAKKYSEKPEELTEEIILKECNGNSNNKFFFNFATYYLVYIKIVEILSKSEENNKEIIKTLVSEKDTNGNTLLHYAVTFYVNYKGVKLLLENGANVNAKDELGDTPLHLAVVNGRLAVVKLLIENGAKIDAKDELGNTPLHLGVLNRHLAVVKLLIEKGSNVNAKGDLGNTPLHLATKNGCLAVVQILRENGTNVNAKDDLGNTPLYLAIILEHYDIVKLLNAKDGHDAVKVNPKDIFGKTTCCTTALLATITITSAAIIFATKNIVVNPTSIIFAASTLIIINLIPKLAIRSLEYKSFTHSNYGPKFSTPQLSAPSAAQERPRENTVRVA